MGLNGFSGRGRKCNRAGGGSERETERAGMSSCQGTQPEVEKYRRNALALGAGAACEASQGSWKTICTIAPVAVWRSQLGGDPWLHRSSSASCPLLCALGRLLR